MFWVQIQQGLHLWRPRAGMASWFSSKCNCHSEILAILLHFSIYHGLFPLVLVRVQWA